MIDDGQEPAFGRYKAYDFCIWESKMGNIFEKLLNFIFPPRCCTCRNVISFDNSRYICEECYASLPFIDSPACRYCGKALEAGECCSECEGQDSIFDRAICACEYKEGMREILHTFKFRGKIKLSGFLSDILYGKIKQVTDISKFDIIICVPLCSGRLKERGFNQSELIAKNLGSRMGVPYRPGVLERTRNTPKQSGLGRADRIGNVCGAFRVADVEPVYGKRVLLVDDILTTGSTLRECSRELKKAGAREITVVAVATGKSDGTKHVWNI